MGNILNLDDIRAALLTDQDLAKLKANGPRALPTSPTANKWSAEAILKQIYTQPEMLFVWLKALGDAIYAMGVDVDDFLSAIEDNYVHLTGDETIAGTKTFSNNVNFDGVVTFNGTLVNGETGYTLHLPNGGTLATNEYVFNKVETEKGKFLDGTYVVYKAACDSNGNPISTTYETKADAQAKVALSNLRTILGLASTTEQGLMSATDKARLDALHALLGESADSDSVVNTINEVLAIFAQYPEGVTLANALAAKVAFSDVINNLESNEISKPLSAYQGKELKALIDALDTVLNAYLVNAASVAPVYDATADYAVGDYVIYNVGLYKCKTAISGGEAWNSEHWEQIVLSDEVDAKITRGAGERDATLSSGYADNADQLNSPDFTTDQAPYLFRTSGGDADIGNREKDTIVGGSLGWNQLVPTQTVSSTNNGITLNSSNDGEYTITVSDPTGYHQIDLINSRQWFAGHKYLILGSKKTSGTYDIEVYIAGYYATVKDSYIVNTSEGSTAKAFLFVGQTTPNGTYKIKPQIFDLTDIFGATIADYIYSLEQATAGAGIAWFKKYFPKTYYPYKAIGGFLHVKLTSHDMVGFNQFDIDSISSQTYATATISGTQITLTGTYYASWAIRLMKGMAYYIRADVSGALTNGMFRFVYEDGALSESAYNKNSVFTPTKDVKAVLIYASGNGTNKTTVYKDVNINLSWSGWRNGQYEAYKKNSYPLDTSVILRGIPQLDTDNNLCYAGDKYHSDGSVEDVILDINLGDINYNKASTTEGGFYATLPDDSYKNEENVPAICSNLVYEGTSRNGVEMYYGNDKSVKLLYNPGAARKEIYVRDISKSALTPAEFKASVDGIHLLVVKETITQGTPATPFQETQEVDDFGTEEYVVPEQDGVSIPVGHYTEYPENLRDKLRRLPNMPTVSESTTATYAVNYNGQTKKCSFVPINDWLVANGYPTGDALKEVLASKEALGGTLRQLLAVSKSIDFANTAWVDLGEQDWAKGTSGSITYFYTTISGIKPGVQNVVSNIVSSLFSTKAHTGYTAGTLNTNMTIAVTGGSTTLVVRYDAYNSGDATAFKAAMKGVLLAYEKASS